MSHRVPILCYHRVHRDDDCPPTPPAGEYCGHVSLTTFRRQMQYLVERRFRTVTHRDLAEWILADKPIPERAVAIDFDDNRIHVFENAFPVLESLGMVATVFVVSQLADGADLGHMSRPYGAMRWKELTILKDAGWLIGAHTRTHKYLADLYPAPGGPREVAEELLGCQEEIARHLGETPAHFAYPAGSWNAEVETLVKRWYRTARLWSPDPSAVYNTRTTDPYRLQAINVSAQLPFETFKEIVLAAEA
ncbi:MAG: polysaccharide deacetylase family protein [Planctomycetota bacterium]